MTRFDAALDRVDWEDIGRQLDRDGFAMLPGLLGIDVARELAQSAATTGSGPAALASSNLGRGELRYFDAGLPTSLAQLRTALYRRLVTVANQWNEALGVDHRYPAELEDFLALNRNAGQTRVQSHLTRLRVEDHLSLHQRNDGERIFPLQVVAVLTAPGVDFLGGEFVTTEQRPRMQSRPTVLPLQFGDAAVIATAERPCKGTRGFYRINLKHGISRVRMGERIGLELSFHDAP